MAAIAAMMRTMFTRIGFSAATAQASIVDDQEGGVDNLAEVKLLTDDNIESLCKVLHRPGGTVPRAGADNHSNVENKSWP